MEATKYALNAKYPLEHLVKKPGIPVKERLVALAKVIYEGADVDATARELFERHGRPVPKHGMQVFAGTYAMVKRWLRTGNAKGIKLCQELGWPIDITSPGTAATVPALRRESETHE